MSDEGPATVSLMEIDESLVCVLLEQRILVVIKNTWLVEWTGL